MWAMIVKEFVQMRRDRMTFATMLFVPILQLTLFGFAINTDPKDLPTAVLVRDDGPLTRAVLSAMQEHRLFRLQAPGALGGRARPAGQAGTVQFAIEIPASFDRDVRRGDKPSVLVIADATDPVATGTAISAAAGRDRHGVAARTARARRLDRERASLRARAPAPLQPGRHHPIQHRARACSASCSP